MEYTKHLPNVSEEYEIIVIKYPKIHLQASILACCFALEPVRGRFGAPSWDGIPKTHKQITFWDPPFGTYL